MSGYDDSRAEQQELTLSTYGWYCDLSLGLRCWVDPQTGRAHVLQEAMRIELERAAPPSLATQAARHFRPPGA